VANNYYDAIVVGSGISGGWAAKELTEKGLKVLMLERGKNIEHVKDYKNMHKETWNYPHRGRPTQEMKKDFPVLSRDYPLNEATLACGPMKMNRLTLKKNVLTGIAVIMLVDAHYCGVVRVIA
jgi:choline dehydrogenase-like flavoprotein